VAQGERSSGLVAAMNGFVQKQEALADVEELLGCPLIHIQRYSATLEHETHLCGRLGKSFFVVCDFDDYIDKITCRQCLNSAVHSGVISESQYAKRIIQMVDERHK